MYRGGGRGARGGRGAFIAPRPCSPRAGEAQERPKRAARKGKEKEKEKRKEEEKERRKERKKKKEEKRKKKGGRDPSLRRALRAGLAVFRNPETGRWGAA